jgi:hypothetical protein
MGFKEAKRKVLDALAKGDFQHETTRSSIDTKNLLSTGDVTTEFVESLVKRCKGQDHDMSLHHSDKSVVVHVLRKDGWYIKFYFLDPDTYFISVHQ